MLAFHFPSRQMANSRKAVVMMFTPVGLQIHYVKIVHTKFFLIKNQGVFEIDPQKGIRYGKTVVYFYDTRSAKPVDPRVMKALDDFAYKNKLVKIKRKDVRHGAELRKLANRYQPNEAIERLKDIFVRKQEKINSKIEDVSKQLEETQLPEEDQSLVLVESLVRANLIEKSDADLLSDQIESGDVSFVELIERLRNLEAVEVQEAITMDAQRFLEDYHTYNPADVDTLLDAAERYADKIRKMGSPEVKNFASAAVIFALLIGGAIAVMILAGTDFSNFLPMLAKDTAATVPSAVPAAVPAAIDATVAEPIVEEAVEEVEEVVEEIVGVPEPIVEEEVEPEVIVEQIDESISKTPQLWTKAD